MEIMGTTEGVSFLLLVLVALDFVLLFFFFGEYSKAYVWLAIMSLLVNVRAWILNTCKINSQFMGCSVDK